MTETLDSLKPEKLLSGYPGIPRTTESRHLDLLILTSEAPPIVSGISTCIGKLAGPTGVLVAPGDSDALRAALPRLVEDPQRLERLQTDSWLGAQAFSWENCIDSYESILFGAVRGRYVRLHGIAMLPGIDQQADDNKEAIR